LESVAKSNLRKAIVYLDGAHLSFKNQNYDSASALAILAAIKAKDALAVSAAGKSKKPRNHLEAVSELRSLPKIPNEVIKAFSALLSNKSEIQYGPDSISESRASGNIEKAALVVELAQQRIGMN
jgi:uncharacterized protein (UPF0332 family)